MAKSKYNPRYLAYCKAMKVGSPEAMMRRDSKKYPGGCMTGFVLWMRERQRKFQEKSPEACMDGHVCGCDKCQTKWDVFLGITKK